MKNRVVCSMAAFALAGSLAFAGEQPKNGVDAAAAFAKLKALAGEWEGKDPKMGKLRTTYEVVSGGSAVMERFTADGLPPGSDMITIYHLDGDQLLLTHYCMAKNQPRMRAVRFDARTGELAFDFLDATGLKPGGGHMHSARFRFTDQKRFTTDWDFMEAGKIKFSESTEYTRVR